MNTKPMTLWYDKPARIWEEALPVGNGRLGAMVFGRPSCEVIQINEDTIWGGGPYRNDNPRAREHLEEVRRLVFAGQWQEAQVIADQHFIADGQHGMPYQLAGSLVLEFEGHDDLSSYRRELDIGSAVASTAYSARGVSYQREVFASLGAPVIVICLTADKPGALDFVARWDSPMPSQSRTDSGMDLILEGQGTEHEGIPGAIRFEARVRVLEHDGTLSRGTLGDTQVLKLAGASRVCLVVAVATNFVDYATLSADPAARVAADLDRVKGLGAAQLRTAHTASYRRWFDRVEVDFGTSPSADLPTDQRIRDFAKGNDPQLAALYFQFGRYLLVASSQPGTQAANLQGIWNSHVIPPWDSKYTTNINVEMNYWPALNTNLLELQEPFERLIAEVAETGRQTAHTMYGARGWCLHHNTDLWRATGAVDRWETSYWAVWPTCGAWFCQHLWFKYLYSGDPSVLKQIWPIMKGAAEFFLDVLVQKPGTPFLVICPGLSPENGHHHKAGIADGVTMDNVMIRELFTNVLEACKTLGVDEEFARKVQAALDLLPPMKVGRWGQLQEWFEDWDRQDDTHRHISHLWGLYPSNQISPLRTPVLAAAARKSLDHRGDKSTGWSMGWKLNCRARLGEGNRAWMLLQDQLRPANTEQMYNEEGGTYPNLLDACAPYQIDGNFGCTAGIAELLLQSHDGMLHLLPALPDALPNGYVRGLSARGGFVIDLYWKAGRITTARIHSTRGGMLRLAAGQPLVNRDGTALTVAKGENPNPFYHITPLDGSDSTKDASLAGGIHLWDIETLQGQTIEVQAPGD